MWRVVLMLVSTLLGFYGQTVAANESPLKLNASSVLSSWEIHSVFKKVEFQDTTNSRCTPDNLSPDNRKGVAEIQGYNQDSYYHKGCYSLFITNIENELQHFYFKFNEPFNIRVFTVNSDTRVREMFNYSFDTMNSWDGNTFSLLLDANESVELFFSIEGDIFSFRRLRLRIFSEAGYLKHTYNDLLVSGVLNGIILFAMFFNFLLYMQLRQKMYLKCALYTLVLFSLCLNMNGYFQQLLLPGIDDYWRVVYVSTLLAMSALQFFIRDVLANDNRLILVWKSLTGMIFINAFATLSILVSADLSVLHLFNNVLFIINCILLFAAGIACLFRSRDNIAIVLAAFGFPACTLGYVILKFFNHSEHIYVDRILLYGTGAWEAIFLAVSTSVWIRKLQASHYATQKKLLNSVMQSEKQLRQFLENVPVGIVVLDSAGQHFFSNSRAKQHYRESMPGADKAEYDDFRHTKVITRGTSLEFEQVSLAAALAGESYFEPEMEIKTGGKGQFISVSSAPIFNDESEVQYAIASISDVTEQNKLRNLQIQFNRELKAEVHRRTEELEQLNGELLERNSELDSFARTVAHDLKQPLCVINNYLDIIGNSKIIKSCDEVVFVNKARHTGSNCVQIIDSLLLFAHSALQEVALKTLDMDDVMIQVWQRIAPLCECYNGDIHIPDCMPAARGYEPWVLAIWFNYFSNALKYGGTPPQITISAEIQDVMVKYCVIDNGPGITEPQRTQLFKPFSRLGKTDQNGTGLGLSIVKQLAEKMGGEAGVSDSRTNGSCFYFTLPK